MHLTAMDTSVHDWTMCLGGRKGGGRVWQTPYAGWRPDPLSISTTLQMLQDAPGGTSVGYLPASGEAAPADRFPAQSQQRWRLVQLSAVHLNAVRGATPEVSATEQSALKGLAHLRGGGCQLARFFRYAGKPTRKPAGDACDLPLSSRRWLRRAGNGVRTLRRHADARGHDHVILLIATCQPRNVRLR